MLNIGIIIPELTKYGGAERVLIECLSRWQHKHTLHVYATEFSPDVLAEHGVGKNVALHKLSLRVENTAYSFLLNASFTPKLWSDEIGRHDVYNTHLWPLHLLDIAPNVWYPHEPLRMLHDLRNDQDALLLASDEERRVHIYPKYNYDTVHVNYFQPMLRATEVFDASGRPYRIVANSHYCAAYIKSVYGMDVSRVVYPGVSGGDFLPPMSSEYLLTVAQLWAHKRIDLCIHALRLIDDMQLYIVGSGPEKNDLIRQAKELGVYDRTFFLSGLTNHELQIVFSRALAVLFMPIREPFGIVALEAMAASKPLIAANEGGYTEVTSPECTFLIPASITAIAEKVNWLRSNPDMATEMGRQGKRIAAQYTWDRTAAELLDEIEDAHACWKKEHCISVTTGHTKVFFGSQYYGWYGKGLGTAHWNDDAESGAVTQTPTSGYYCSSNPAIVEQHLKIAEDIGLDFFLFNLHVDKDGASGDEIKALSIMLEQAKHTHSPVKICVQLCPYNPDEADMKKFYALLRDKIFPHTSYFLFNERPLLSVFWTGQHDRDKTFLHLLRQQTEPAWLITSSLRIIDRQENTLTYGTFDGWAMFSPLELSAGERWEDVWAEASASPQGPAAAIRCMSVSPGYDDTALASPLRQGNPYRNVPRNNGATYKRMWEFALASSPKPDLLIVSTFNEFHENTHIEPTVETNALYLDLTRDFIRQGKALWRS